MPWFFIALTASFLWSLVNISDQYLVNKYSVGKRGSGGLVLFSSLIGIFTAAVIWIFVTNLFGIPISDIVLLILIGGLTIAWVVLYLFALEIEEVSSVVPWFLTIPVFGYALGYIFLGETLSFQQLVGSLIVLLGVFLIPMDFSVPKTGFKLNRWISAFYMLVACFLVAVSGVIFKYVTVGNDFWISSFWEYVGLGFFGILLYIFIPKYRLEFTLMNRSGGARIFLLNTISEIFTIVGNLLSNYALLLAPVAMVYLVGSFQPAIVLFLTVFFTKFFSGIAKENLRSPILFHKIFAIIIMILGSIVLFI